MNLDKNFRPYLCCIEMICFNFGRLKKLNLRLFYLSLHFCAYTILFQFGRIWTNLNETFWPYSCGIEMIFFNDEKLKKWNLRLLKSSMRIYAYLCASMRVLGYPVFNMWLIHLVSTWIHGSFLDIPAFDQVHTACTWNGGCSQEIKGFWSNFLFRCMP